jgi:hypothetical protein
LDRRDRRSSNPEDPKKRMPNPKKRTLTRDRAPGGVPTPASHPCHRTMTARRGRPLPELRCAGRAGRTALPALPVRVRDRESPATTEARPLAPNGGMGGAHRSRPDYFNRGWADGLCFPTGTGKRVVQLHGPYELIGRTRGSDGVYPRIDLSATPRGPGVSTIHAILDSNRTGRTCIVGPRFAKRTRLNDEQKPIERDRRISLHDGDKIFVGAWSRVTIAARSPNPTPSPTPIPTPRPATSPTPTSTPDAVITDPNPATITSIPTIIGAAAAHGVGAGAKRVRPDVPTRVQSPAFRLSVCGGDRVGAVRVPTRHSRRPRRPRLRGPRRAGAVIGMCPGLRVGGATGADGETGAGGVRSRRGLPKNVRARPLNVCGGRSEPGGHHTGRLWLLLGLVTLAAVVVGVMAVVAVEDIRNTRGDRQKRKPHRRWLMRHGSAPSWGPTRPRPPSGTCSRRRPPVVPATFPGRHQDRGPGLERAADSNAAGEKERTRIQDANGRLSST